MEAFALRLQNARYKHVTNPHARRPAAETPPEPPVAPLVSITASERPVVNSEPETPVRPRGSFVRFARRTLMVLVALSGAGAIAWTGMAVGSLGQEITIVEKDYATLIQECEKGFNRIEGGCVR